MADGGRTERKGKESLYGWMPAKPFWRSIAASEYAAGDEVRERRSAVQRHDFFAACFTGTRLPGLVAFVFTSLARISSLSHIASCCCERTESSTAERRRQEEGGRDVRCGGDAKVRFEDTKGRQIPILARAKSRV